MQHLSLDETAHVFLCKPEAIDDPALLERYGALLDAEERARHARFHFARDAHTFLIAHALVRTALSQFADVPPSEWRFRTNAYGRPDVEISAGTLRFNLSHCRGLAACIVVAGMDCEVDVEEICAAGDLRDLATRYFSPSEVAALRACPPESTADRFFSLWTLKEAYIKARGLGLSLPLDRFSFNCGDAISVTFDAEIADNPAAWAFTLSQQTPKHFLATALRHEAGRIPAVAIHRYVPLVGFEL